MCGRTASTRPPNVLIRVTGAARYIPAAPRPRPPRDGANRGRGGGGGRGAGRQRGGGGGGQGQRYQQHNQQLAPHTQPAEQATTEETNDALTVDEEKEAEGDSTETYSDAYRPSYNAGPHFYLPVLRYVKNGQDDDDAEEDDSSVTASGRTQRKAADDPHTTADKQSETQQLAAQEDFTTDGRGDLPTSNPTSPLPPPTPATTPAAEQSSTPSGESSIELVLQPMRWGLIPHWTSATSLAAADAAQSYNMINARAESVDQAKSYRSLIKRRRCVVVVDSYYEWHTSTIHGRTTKQPFSFVPNHTTPPISTAHSAATPAPVTKYDRTADDKPFFLLAGLYDTWRDPSTATVLYSVTVLTTSASQKLGWCHERQPVILSHDNAKRWLDVWGVPWGEEMRQLVCRPYSDGVSWYKVPEIVGSVRNQQSECTQPLDEYMAAKKAAGIGKFFGAASSTTSKPAKVELDGDMQVKPTAGKSVSDDWSVADAASMSQQQDGVKVEADGVKAEGGVKRARDESASNLLRTPEKKMKSESSRSRSVSPASGGSAVKKEELGKNQKSLTSFFQQV